jgi:hypothetical protein
MNHKAAHLFKGVRIYKELDAFTSCIFSRVMLLLDAGFASSKESLLFQFFQALLNVFPFGHVDLPRLRRETLHSTGTPVGQRGEGKRALNLFEDFLGQR